jgi:hypothetical protein
MVRIHSLSSLNMQELPRRALEEKLDGFTLMVDRMPDPEWLSMAEARVIQSGLTVHFVIPDHRTGRVSFRELCGSVGIFPGPRRIRSLPLKPVGEEWDPDFTEVDPSLVILLEKEASR